MTAGATVIGIDIEKGKYQILRVSPLGAGV